MFAEPAKASVLSFWKEHFSGCLFSNGRPQCWLLTSALHCKAMSHFLIWGMVDYIVTSFYCFSHSLQFCVQKGMCLSLCCECKVQMINSYWLPVIGSSNANCANICHEQVFFGHVKVNIPSDSARTLLLFLLKEANRDAREQTGCIILLRFEPESQENFLPFVNHPDFNWVCGVLGGISTL